MRKLISGSVLALAVFACASAHGKIIDVMGPASSAGTLPSKLMTPPSHVIDTMVTNTGIQGFDEKQGVTTTIAHAIDGGTIAMGTVVDSHMLFLNSPGTSTIMHSGVTFTFDRNIIGVMSDIFGMMETMSTPELGLPPGTTVYPGGPFQYRGLEPQFGDTYVVAGNKITLNINVTQPGDWLRVVTAGEIVPEPTGLMALCGLGLMGLIGHRRRRK